MAYLLLCDDDAAFVASLQNQIERLFPSLGLDIYTATHEQAYRQLIRTRGLPTLIFMDIELDGVNGLTLAAEAYALAPEVPFIFVTAHNARYSQQLFLQDIHVVGYLEKPVQDDLLRHLLSRALKNLGAPHPRLPLRVRRKTILLDTAAILYLESDGHRVFLHMQDGTIYVQRDRLVNLAARLPDSFLRVHVSFLVNMAFITSFGSHDLTLCDTITLPISRNTAKDAQRLYLRYRGSKL